MRSRGGNTYTRAHVHTRRGQTVGKMGGDTHRQAHTHTHARAPARARTDAPRAIYRLSSSAVVLVVLPVLLQLRRGLAGETSLVEIALDRAPDLPAIEHRRALVVEQRRVLDHYAQQMQPLVLAEEILPACALVAGSCASRVRTVPGRHHRVPPRPSRPPGTLFSQGGSLRGLTTARHAQSTLVRLLFRRMRSVLPNLRRCADFSPRRTLALPRAASAREREPA